MSLVWSLLTSWLAGPIAAAAAAALACLLATALVAHGLERTRADGLARDRDRWKASAVRWEASAAELKRSFEAAEGLRVRETAAAKDAADQAGKACEARVAAARRSARAIETIVRQETSRDANGCPARGLVPRERLRDALTPAG